MTFLLIFLPSYIDTLWSLYERIKGYIPKISLQWFSINHLYVVTIPVGLYFLVAIWTQTRKPTSPVVTKKDTSPEAVSDLGKKILKALAIPIRDRNVRAPTEDELQKFTKLDRLKLRVEYRVLRDKNLLYKDQYNDRIHLSEKGEKYVLTKLLDKDD